MKKNCNNILKSIHDKLEIIDFDRCDISIEESASMINYLEKKLYLTKEYFLSNKNIKQEEEILFFKEIKPEILGFLLYFNKIHTIELKCPMGRNDTLREYYEKELESLTYFFERNIDFYQYYRSKSTHFDEQYFVRKKSNDYKLCIESIHFIMDHSFSTGYDYKVAKIICNEMLRIYLNKQINGLEKQLFIEKKRARLPIGNLKWTGPKVALTEIGYALEANSYVNNGHADIKEIMIGLEILFNIDLGEYYRTYISIKDREDRTKYLNILMERLKLRMDEDDTK